MCLWCEVPVWGRQACAGQRFQADSTCRYATGADALKLQDKIGRRLIWAFVSFNRFELCFACAAFTDMLANLCVQRIIVTTARCYRDAAQTKEDVELPLENA